MKNLFKRDLPLRQRQPILKHLNFWFINEAKRGKFEEKLEVMEDFFKNCTVSIKKVVRLFSTTGSFQFEDILWKRTKMAEQKKAPLMRKEEDYVKALEG